MTAWPVTNNIYFIYHFWGFNTLEQCHMTEYQIPDNTMDDTLRMGTLCWGVALRQRIVCYWD